MKKPEREFVERIFGSKKFGYFFVFLGIWFVLDAIRTSGSEVWTDPGFWVGFLMVLVWSRILVVVQKKKSINQLQEKKFSGEEDSSRYQEQEDGSFREVTQDEWDQLMGSDSGE